jgi:hypothetical protein
MKKQCWVHPYLNSIMARDASLVQYHSASIWHCAEISQRGDFAAMGRCPFGVKRVGFAMSESLPLFPDKQTFSGSVGMSQRCQMLTFRNSAEPCWRADA